MSKKARILIVDNDLEWVGHVRELLETAGYEALTAPDSAAGFSKVEYEQPDLVVLELMLENHDAGFRLARRIKDHPIFSTLPLLMVTGTTERTGFTFSMEQDGYWMQVDDYLAKPVADEELLGRIEKLLGNASEQH